MNAKPLPKWKRLRPGLYRIKCHEGEGHVERGAETGAWYWVCTPAKHTDRKRRIGMVNTLVDGKDFVDAFLNITRP